MRRRNRRFMGDAPCLRQVEKPKPGQAGELQKAGDKRIGEAQPPKRGGAVLSVRGKAGEIQKRQRNSRGQRQRRLGDQRQQRVMGRRMSAGAIMMQLIRQQRGRKHHISPKRRAGGYADQRIGEDITLAKRQRPDKNRRGEQHGDRPGLRFGRGQIPPDGEVSHFQNGIKAAPERK